ncbi:DUF4347 domain-containing protein, partial [Mastigocoleus testarum]
MTVDTQVLLQGNKFQEIRTQEIQPQEIAFFDTTVKDYQSLIAGLRSGIEVVILDPEKDGVKQITTVLANRSNIARIHVISHGSPGCLYLGNTELSLSSLNLYAEYLKSWFRDKLSNSQLLLYGCNVAAGDGGEEFITKLSHITGAEIAASETLTGNLVLGGNWNLEFTTADFEVPLIFHSKAIVAYQAVLAIDVTSPTDRGWNAITPSGANAYDFAQDQQTGSTESDLTGDAGNPMFYLQFDGEGDAGLTNGTIAFRLRVGEDGNPSGFSRNLFIGIDVTGDGAVDLYVGVNNQGSTDSLAIWDPGTGANNSPSTTTIVSPPLLTYAQTADNYNFSPVDSTIDPGITNTDLNGDSANDYFLSFSIPFSDIVTQLATLGITGVDETTAVSFVVGTATQDNSYNQDIGGIDGGINLDTTWTDLGAISNPIRFDGSTPNNPPVGVADTSTTQQETPVVIDVAANDTDSEGTVDLTTVAIDNGPGNGTTAINPITGEITYIPKAGFTGTDTFTYTVEDDAGDASTPITVTVNVTPSDTPAVTIPVTENITDVANITIEDPDGDTLTYSIGGGDDAGSFTINPETGLLSFKTAPDFEDPTDTDGDNVYEVEVIATDPDGNTILQAANIEVTDVDESEPTALKVTITEDADDDGVISLDELDGDIKAVVELPSNAKVGDTLVVTDQGGIELFNEPITQEHIDNGVAVTTTAPEDGSPVNITATLNGDTANDVATVETPTPVGIITVQENITDVANVTAEDPDGDTLTYSIGGGDDADSFTINPETGLLSFKTAPDFEDPTDTDGDNVYEVEVVATDPDGNTILQAANIEVTDVDESEPTALKVTITEDADDDGVISPDELNGEVDAIVELPSNAVVGDTLVVTDQGGTELFNGPITQQHIDNGIPVTTTVPEDGSPVNITATLNGDTANDVATVETPTPAATITVPENRIPVANVTATDPEGDPLTYSIGGGDDADSFTVDPETGLLSFKTAPDFENPSDTDGDNIYEVEVVGTDPDGNTISQPANIEVTDVDDTVIASLLITSPETTDDTTPEITGTAEPGITVILEVDASDDGTPEATYETIADDEGNWSVDLETATPTDGTTPVLNGGDKPQISVTTVDDDGNVSDPVTQKLTINPLVPDTPIAPDLAPSDDSGVDDADNITSETTPTFTAPAE